MSFLNRLKERKLVQWALAYVAGAWVVLQVMDVLAEPWELSLYFQRFLQVSLVAGLPVTLVLAWYHGEKGRQRVGGVELLILAALLSLAGVGISRLTGGPSGTATAVSGETVPGSSGHRTAVLPPENHTGDPSLDRYANWAADHITDGLARAELTSVVPFTEVMSVLADTANGERVDLVRTWPRDTGAALAVLGGFYTRGDLIEFRLRIVDSDGTVLGTVEPVHGPTQDPGEALAALQVRVVGALAGVVAPGHDLQVTTQGRRPPNLEAHEALVEGWVIALAEDWEASLPYLERARALDPQYATALFVQAQVYINTSRLAEADSLCAIMEGRFDTWSTHSRISAERVCAGVTGDLATGLEKSLQLLEYSPNAISVTCIHYLRLNRPRAATDACSRFDPSLGRIAREWEDTNRFSWAEALHLLEEYALELDVALEGRARFPDHLGLNFAQIRALHALGRRNEAQLLLEDRLALLGPGRSPALLLDRVAQEQYAHGDSAAAIEAWERSLHWFESRPRGHVNTPNDRRRRADAFLHLGRLGEAEVVAASLFEEFPESFSDLARVGVVRARLGDRRGAAAVAQRLGDWDAPFLHGEDRAWQARILAELGEVDRAVELLAQAHAEGWTILDKLHRDPYLRPLHGDPSYEEFQRPKG